MAKAKDNFDVIIVGGGPVGMTAALLLCQKGLKTAMLDRLDYSHILDEDYDGRTFAYAYGSKLILEQMGVWCDLEANAEPIRDIYVTSEGPGQGLHYNAREVANHPMGYNIETRFYRSVIFKQLQQQENFELIAPCKIDNISFELATTSVHIDDDQRILNAPLILAADGKNSFIRKQVGIKSKQVPYNQKALVLVIEHTNHHNNCAYEHFLQAGPIAILPMKGNKSGVIWSLRDDRADHFYALPDQELAKEIEEHFGQLLGKIKLVGNRWLFPLDVTIVKNYVAHRMVLIGDSAHGIHPVAGQGFNLGLRDVYDLAKHLEKSRNLGLDIGSISQLKEYERKRRVDVVSMTGICDGLVRLFSNDNRSVGHIRRIGLDITDRLPMLKRVLTKHAMGLR